MAGAARIGLDNPAFQGRLRAKGNQASQQIAPKSSPKQTTISQGGYDRQTVQRELARIFGEPETPLAPPASTVALPTTPVTSPPAAVLPTSVASAHSAQDSPATQVMVAANVEYGQTPFKLTDTIPAKPKAKLSDKDRGRMVAASKSNNVAPPEAINQAQSSSSVPLPVAVTPEQPLESAAQDDQNVLQTGVEASEPENFPVQLQDPITSTVASSSAQSSHLSAKKPLWTRHVSGWQLAMLGLASMTLFVGIAISIQTSRANNAAQAELTSLVNSYR